ncbi:hypothetical protein WICPIJ_005411 [Wickerhamomyces pijperi]|uniref:Nucleolar protein 12 n=1 Tax=Wickerhamomyces pijperi TaxID=599730 RepID=A0A9P8TLZ5_WICPI|nr:hypothetical protein WICPIJ_005411 [Wickerhamomyces pijperi]
MSGGISDLFGNAKRDETVSNLFDSSASTGPLKRSLRERTVVEVKETELLKDLADEEQQEAKQPKKKKAKKADKDEHFDLEAKYLEKLTAEDEEEEEESSNKQEATATEETKEGEEYESDSDDDEEDQVEDPKPKAASAAKSIDLKEAEIEKAERTIFVGNLHSKVIPQKKEFKEFKAYFLKCGEIESIRFRSIAFNEALPRKVAFVQQKLHTSRDSVNSYIVFKNKESVAKAVKLNAEVLFGLHIRVDSIAHPAKADNSRTIFVGNLDFEEKEEELWNIFGSCGDIENVRIVRDSKTNVGKGFAYVQFKDFTSVSKALLMNEKRLGEKKRKLRISRAKKMKTNTGADDKKSSSNFNRPQRVEKPRQANGKKQRHKNLTDEQKTKLGRAKTILGKADRSTAGGEVLEGTRAKKGDSAAGIKNGKRGKKPRIRERSSEFKKVRDGK